MTPADNGDRLPTPSPEPPHLNHHTFYVCRKSGGREGLSDVEDSSEYYSETTATSGIEEDDPQLYERNPYIIPPKPSHILLEASKNPSYPKIMVSPHGACRLWRNYHSLLTL